jgi:hypothetical protein
VRKCRKGLAMTTEINMGCSFFKSRYSEFLFGLNCQGRVLEGVAGKPLFSIPHRESRPLGRRPEIFEGVRLQGVANAIRKSARMPFCLSAGAINRTKTIVSI